VGTVSVGDSALDVWQWLNLPKIKPPQANALLRSLKSKTLPTLGLEDVAGAGTQLEPHTPQVVVSVFPVQAKGEDRSGGWSLGDVNSAQVFNFSSGEMPLHLVKPSFIYGDREVTLASTERLFPDPDNQGASLLRNDIFEKEVEKQLIELGLIPNRNPRRSQDRRGDGLFRVSPDHFNYQAIFLQTVAQLVKYAQARGWKIDIPASVLPVVVKDEDLGVTLCGEEGSPWFEAALDIKAGDATIDLGEVILTFLYKNRYSLESIHLSQAEKVVVMLDHHCIEFERERLLRLLKVVRELSDPEHTKALRFNRYSGYAFEGALRDSFGRWESGSEIAALRERVAQIERRPAVGEPPLFEGNLRDYQQQGLAWLSVLSEAELGGVLADDMGLGKTVQIIALILRERSRGMRGPHLVVCPKSVVPNWSAELARFAPSLKVYSSIGAGRSKSVELLEEADVVITTYPLLLKDVELLRKVRFDVAVFDEAQHIKNPQTGAYRAAEGLTARLKIPVSGTPLENNLQDLWAHFNLSMPGFLYSRDVFTKTYRKPIEREGNAELREHLAARIKPFVLRRTKAEVAKELPPLTEIIVRCSLDGAQRDLYEAIRQLTTKRVREALRSKGASRSHIEFLDALLKLRQVCCDARLVKTTAAKGVKKSAKLESLLELLETLLAEGRAIVVFSQFTSMLELIEQEVQAREIPYCLLTGQSNDRELSVKNFQAGEKKLFLMSLKAGGVGINLTAADAVVIYDPWWNPAVESQAICRAHRIGQTSPVFAYRLIAEGTIEEKILDLQARKRALVENLLAENESPPELSEELVEYLFAPME
jgi:superfamily II DNA or RNA helicase